MVYPKILYQDLWFIRFLVSLGGTSIDQLRRNDNFCQSIGYCIN